jgi:hypothetical protein
MDKLFKTLGSGFYLVLVSLIIAVVYGVVFRLNYVQTIDAQLCIVFFIFAVFTYFICLGFFKLVQSSLRGKDK